MSAPKLTKWFDAYDANPKHIGVYLSTVDKREKFYRYWDGNFWHYGASTPQAAFDCQGKRWRYFGLYWRGLASDPAKAKRGGK